MVISPYAKKGYIDHQTLSSDAYLKFIEDDFLGGSRLNPKTDKRPDPRPDVHEDEKILGNMVNDFNFNQSPGPRSCSRPTPLQARRASRPTSTGWVRVSGVRPRRPARKGFVRAIGGQIYGSPAGTSTHSG